MAVADHDMERLLPVLVHVQTHLEQDLSLERLAQLAHLSPFHFHRLFRATIGETLKQYTQRLRLERAAYHLRIRDETVLDVALNSGFNAHETFTRAFKRHFGITPQAFRDGSVPLQIQAAPAPGASLNRQATGYSLSAARVQHLAPIDVVFIRSLGPYTDVEVGLYDELEAWLKAKGLYTGDNLLMGIGHDAPAITPVDRQRFDACIQVPRRVEPEGRIGHQVIPGGYYATVTYIGPYGPAMEQAYAEMFPRMAAIEGYRMIGLPAVEIYRTTRINPEYSLNETDIYLPVEKERI